MPRSERTEAAQAIVSEASGEYLLRDYTAEDWGDSSRVETLAHVAALLKADGREVPDAIADALWKATEAGRPVGAT